MNIHATAIDGLHILEPAPRRDERGVFARLFCERDLQPIIGARRVVQINQSQTVAAGAVRGLHFQRSPHAEMKLIRCSRGRVWDVAVDLRSRSPTFLKWHAEELSATNMRMIVIPEGFAHGFQVIEPMSELLYLHTEFYSPAAEGGIRFNDPRLCICWPLEVTDVSAKDLSHPLIERDFRGLL